MIGGPASIERAAKRADARARQGLNKMRELRAPHLALDALADRLKALKRETLAVVIAARDPRTPWPAKLLAGLVVAYALSPIDLIPDFIPVLGYLDDLLLIPAGIWLVLRLIPPEVIADARIAAATAGRPGKSLWGLLIVVTVWLAIAALMAWWWWPSAR